MNAKSATVSLALTLLAGSALAQPSFQSLGNLGPHSSGDLFSYPYRIAGDGKTVVGYASAPAGYIGFRWTQQAGMVAAAGGPTSGANGLSFDGSVMVGEAFGSSGFYHAFRWTQNTGNVDLGDFPGGLNSSVAWDCSADGSVVVGAGNYDGTFKNSHGRGFRWTQATGMVDIGSVQAGDDDIEPWACSDDGNILVGGSGIGGGRTQAFRWTQGTGMVGLGRLGNTTEYSFAWNISANGNVIVGDSATNTPYLSAFRWSQGTGMVSLGTLVSDPPTPHSSALAVNADGTLIGGIAYLEPIGNSTSQAFIWDQAHGMRRLADVLTNEYHLDVRGWQLYNVNSISADGKVITGFGKSPLGNEEAWIVRLESCTDTQSCPSDFNKDGFVNGDDFDGFVDAFVAGC